MEQRINKFIILFVINQPLQQHVLVLSVSHDGEHTLGSLLIGQQYSVQSLLTAQGGGGHVFVSGGNRQFRGWQSSSIVVDRVLKNVVISLSPKTPIRNKTIVKERKTSDLLRICQ